MKLASIRIQSLGIPFRAAFRHASAERARTETLWIEAHGADGCIGHGEGCPRRYVTGETLKSAAAFVAAHEADWRRSIRDLETLQAWVERNARAIDENPAAWCAVEMALLDLFGRHEGRSLEALLGLPALTGRFRYSAVIGDVPEERFGAELQRYLDAGFRNFKIKLAGDPVRDGAKVEALAAAGIAPARVRADANNAWADAGEALCGLANIGSAFWAIEEPLRAHDYGGMARIAAATGACIVLDESVLRIGHLAQLPTSRHPWVVNLRISKMGGVLRALAFARAASQHGVALIVGCQVGETSFLTRAALTVVHAVQANVLAQEGAFGTHLLERDVVDAPLMFGAGGVLDIGAAALSGPGLGLEARPAPGDLTLVAG